MKREEEKKRLHMHFIIMQGGLFRRERIQSNKTEADLSKDDDHWNLA